MGSGAHSECKSIFYEEEVTGLLRCSKNDNTDSKGFTNVSVSAFLEVDEPFDEPFDAGKEDCRRDCCLGSLAIMASISASCCPLNTPIKNGATT